MGLRLDHSIPHIKLIGNSQGWVKTKWTDIFAMPAGPDRKASYSPDLFRFCDHAEPAKVFSPECTYEASEWRCGQGYRQVLVGLT